MGCLSLFLKGRDDYIWGRDVIWGAGGAFAPPEFEK